MATRDDEYYINESMIIIRVEDKLFRVPQHILTTNSPVFRDMFTLPVPKDSEPDGYSDEQPLILEGIKAADFTCLLRCIYPVKFCGRSFSFTLDEWKGVLGLANTYQMTDVREFAVEEMTPLVKNIYPALQVHLSQHYDVQSWLVSGAHELVQRPEPLSAVDIQVIGASYAAIIMSLREDRTRKFMVSPRRVLFNEHNEAFLTRLGLQDYDTRLPFPRKN